MTATPALAKRCDACDEATSVLLTTETLGADFGQICPACLDLEIEKSGAAAPGCYCSLSIRCDFCAGLRVWGVADLNNPAKTKAAAERIGTTSKALARWSGRHLREAGLEITGRRVEAGS